MTEHSECLAPPSVPAPTPLLLDFTAAEDFCWCARLHMYRYHMGLVPAGEEWSAALSMGDGLHQARAVLAEGGSVDDALARFDSAYTQIYEESGCLDLIRTPYIGRAMIHAYVQKWGLPDDLHTEVGAALDMDGFILYGKVDAIWKDPMHTVSDLKHTSGMIWLPTARPNWQLVGYAYMAHELTGIKPGQVCVDGIVLPRIGKKMLERVLPPEPEFALTVHDYLHRRTAVIYERDYNEWMLWIRTTAEDIQRCAERGHWPMRTPKPCTRYNRDCAYMTLCKAPEMDTEARLRAALYVHRPWHPYELTGGVE